MLTAALSGLAVHVPPPSTAAVQPSVWELHVHRPIKNVTEALLRLWQPASTTNVLTIYVEVLKAGSMTVRNTITNAVASNRTSYCVINAKQDTTPCFGDAIVFGVGLAAAPCFRLGADANISRPFVSPAIAP